MESVDTGSCLFDSIQQTIATIKKQLNDMEASIDRLEKRRFLPTSISTSATNQTHNPTELLTQNLTLFSVEPSTAVLDQILEDDQFISELTVPAESVLIVKTTSEVTAIEEASDDDGCLDGILSECTPVNEVEQQSTDHIGHVPKINLVDLMISGPEVIPSDPYSLWWSKNELIEENVVECVLPCSEQLCYFNLHMCLPVVCANACENLFSVSASLGDCNFCSQGVRTKACKILIFDSLLEKPPNEVENLCHDMKWVKWNHQKYKGLVLPSIQKIRLSTWLNPDRPDKETFHPYLPTVGKITSMNTVFICDATFGQPYVKASGEHLFILYGKGYVLKNKVISWATNGKAWKVYCFVVFDPGIIVPLPWTSLQKTKHSTLRIGKEIIILYDAYHSFSTTSDIGSITCKFDSSVKLGNVLVNTLKATSVMPRRFKCRAHQSNVQASFVSSSQISPILISVKNMIGASLGDQS